MWGCLKGLVWVFAIVAVALLIAVSGGWWLLGSTNFADYVRQKIESTLEARLGRDVTIRSVTFVRSTPQRIILNDVRVANAPGAVAPHFATVRQVEITGGVQSFWRRNVKVERVDVRDPRLFFEVFPDGSPLVHNFPKWNSGPPRKRQIVHIEIGKLFVSDGAFSFLDRKHEITAVASNVDSQLTITQAEDLYEGLMTSPQMRVRLQDYEPFDVRLRGGFRYTPGVLALRSVALEGAGIETFLSGKLDPLTEGAYDLRLRSRLSLERIGEIFRVENALRGTLALDTRLHGTQGQYQLSGGWTAPAITADAYTLSDVKGSLDVTDERLVVDVDRAVYGGGTIGAHYTLAKYEEPYPMSTDLRYDGISLEQLFNDWTVKNTGLRTAATGTLTYRWNKDKILEGHGEGSARLARSATAFSQARYAIPVAGSTGFALDHGVVTFRSAELDTDSSHISLTGTLEIENLIADLNLAVRSSDFSELDRLGYNFAHAADKKDYTLLGLGGSGTLSGTVKGAIDKARVTAAISGTRTRYNEVLLGDSELELRYDGNRSELVFDRAVFRDAGGQLSLTGTVEFTDVGGPRFDIAVDATGYPAQRAIDAVELDLKIGEGLATGKLEVSGTPETGTARFTGLTIRRSEATLALNGSVNWLPGEGNVVFDLQIAATNFPVADIAAFLDFGDLPVTGELTGTLQIAGRKESLEGSGRVTVRRGTIAGEAIELASADISFTAGRMKATGILVQSPAGEIRGEAEADLAKEAFSYSITSSSIDLSKLELLSGLKDLLGGRITLTSTGAGTFTDPELVVEATLEDATVKGLTLPAGSAPPSLYLAIRNGRLIVRGAIADIVSIEGDGTVGENKAIEGLVRITVSDIARALAISPKTASIPAAGNAVIELRLGGRLSPIEQLLIEATVPELALRVAEHDFMAPEPLRITLRNGRIELDSFALRHTDSIFAIAGFAEVTGAKRLDIDLRGQLEAALLQLFMPDSRAEGVVDLAISIGGTMTAPAVLGSAEFRDAELKLAGFPQLIDEINGTLRFGRNRIDIESVRATVGGGTVVTGGYVTLDGMAPRNIRVTLQGADVSIRYFEGLTLESNFALVLTGSSERVLLQGDVDVTRALYFRDFELQQALLNIILARNRIAAVSAATWQDRVGLRINLTAQETLAVRNNIAEVTGSAELTVTGTLASPVILGEVTLDEGGTVRIQNVAYRVVRGTITFQNPFRIDPFVDITVEGTVSGFGSSETEGGPYEVTVNVTGTLDRLTPTITSDPPASDITLFSILGFGGIGSRDASQQAGGVGVFGQSLLYSGLSSLIGSRVFPFVDSFAYDPGTLDAGAGAGARVTFEKRLSNKVRFLLVYNLVNQQSRQVIEWLVNPTWTLQLTRDEADEYRVDARFRRRYEAQWKFGGDEEASLATGAVLTQGAAPQAPATPTSETAVVRPPPVTTVNPRAADDRPIAQINLRADSRFDTSAVAKEVTLAPGQRVTIRELQSSIKNLFATGNFRDVRVDAASAEAGVVLTFSLYLHYRINEIELAGLGRSDRVRAQRKLTVRSGEVLSLDDVQDSAAAVEEMLRQNGYLEATVDAETKFDRAKSLAAVTLTATPGPRALVGEVILEGKLEPFTKEQLIDRMTRGPGEGFHLLEAREDAGRMRNFMVRRDHRRAKVEFLGHQYDPVSHNVTLRYRAQAGPLVRVAITGVDSRSIRRLLPFARNQEYSEDAIDQAADRITEGLQQRGHFQASVDTESELKDNVWTTTFVVKPGPVYRLTEVGFTGNERINEDDLQEIVATSARGGFRRLLQTLLRRPSGVTRTQLSDDRDAVEAYYRLQGFAEATVGTPAATPRADGTLRVEFPIVEGPQTLLADVRIEGNEKFETRRLPELLLEKGAPFNPQLLHEDIVALQSFYANQGHVEVQVAPRVEVSADRTSATIAYVVAEGPRVNVDEVTVRGNTYTDRDVVLRKAELDPGDPFSYTSLLEAQRELYRLGIFQRVEVQAQQADTTVADRDVVIQVDEGRNLTLTGSVGLRAERGQNPGSGIEFHERVAIAAAHRNLFGSGRYLGLEGVFSRDETEAFLTYREPFIGRWNVPVQLQIFQTDDSTRFGTSILQQGTSIEATKVARLRSRWSLRYEYKISRCDGGTVCKDIIERGEPVEGLDRSLLNIQISSITPTFFWDTRDDIIDPRRGFFTSASLEYAFPLFEATAGFLKEYVQGAYYLPVSKRTVVALSGRVGLIQAYARRFDEDLNLDVLRPIPLSERFTAGGETSHRGFGLDRLGDLCLTPPPDLAKIDGCEPTLFTTIDEESRTIGSLLPLGGSSMLLFNAEYRFPILGTLGGAIFADIGNVYAGSKIHFNQLRYGAGLGFRYLSPVGPVRVDIAMPFDRRWYEDQFQYFITLGYAF